MLDLCFVLHPSYIYQYKIVPSLSDHDAIIVDMFHYTPCNIAPKRKYIVLKNQTGSTSVQNLKTLLPIFNEKNSRSVQNNRDYFHQNLLQAELKILPG